MACPEATRRLSESGSTRGYARARCSFRSSVSIRAPSSRPAPMTVTPGSTSARSSVRGSRPASERAFAPAWRSSCRTGHAGLVLPRSGLAARHGIALVNAPGLIDEGYRGELQVLLLNTDRDRRVRDRSGGQDRAARDRPRRAARRCRGARARRGGPRRGRVQAPPAAERRGDGEGARSRQPGRAAGAAWAASSRRRRAARAARRARRSRDEPVGEPRVLGQQRPVQVGADHQSRRTPS